MDKSAGEWYLLMLILAVWFVINVILIVISFKPDPKADNITINLDEEIKALMRVQSGGG